MSAKAQTEQTFLGFDGPSLKPTRTSALNAEGRVRGITSKGGYVSVAVGVKWVSRNGLFFRGNSAKSTSIEAMSFWRTILQTPNRRIGVVALSVVVLDQLTKEVVRQSLVYPQEKVILDGFFKFVHWSNTGAAWSLFRGNNLFLAVVAIAALFVLHFSRHHFDSRTLLGQVAFGLIFGGIIGNLIDRLFRKGVIDFIYFYLQQRGGGEIGFPAFNIADSAICTGVGLIFLLTWKNERDAKPVTAR